ncbi:YlzJ-like family protein [Paenibacillus yanchengensis]|uniref:YlzJ-like family protein n=1 Tax=Paenibacillus yanchengensis TaxID=2035833 RepID=A0ABW4YM83_9BACL
MVMYTIVSDQLLFADDQPFETSIEVQISGRTVAVTPIASGVGKVVRLIDCSLEDYLNPIFTPGNIIHYSDTTL